MMNLVVMVLALAGALLIEAACPAADWVGQAKPPLVMCLVLYYAMCRPLPLLMGSVIVGGVATDCLNALPPGCSNALPLGYSALGLAAVGLLARVYRDVVVSGQWITHMVFGALAGLGMTLALYGLLWLTDPGVRDIPAAWIAMKVLGAGAYGLLLAPIVFRLMDRLDRMVGNLRVEAAE